MWRTANNVPPIMFLELLQRLKAINIQALQDLYSSIDADVIIAFTRWTQTNSVDLANADDFAALDYLTANLSWSWDDALIDQVFQVS